MSQHSEYQRNVRGPKEKASNEWFQRMYNSNCFIFYDSFLVRPPWRRFSKSCMPIGYFVMLVYNFAAKLRKSRRTAKQLCHFLYKPMKTLLIHEFFVLVDGIKGVLGIQANVCKPFTVLEQFLTNLA